MTSLSPFFTAGVGYTTLSVHIYSLLKFGITPKINAISTMLLANSIVFILLFCGSKGVRPPPKNERHNSTIIAMKIQKNRESEFPPTRELNVSQRFETYS